MKVKIICGAYGHRPTDRPGTVKTVRAGQCCEVSDEEASRLVKLGVAEYTAEEPVATPPAEPEDDGTGTNTPPADDGSVGLVMFSVEELPEAAKSLDIVDGHFTEESLNKLTNADLKALAIDLGLDPKKCGNKASLVALILPVNIVDDEGEDDGTAPPADPGDTIVQ